MAESCFFSLFQAQSKICQTPVVANSLKEAYTVVSNLILRHSYMLTACRSLLKCVAHSKSQELNDELSVGARLLLGCL